MARLSGLRGVALRRCVFLLAAVLAKVSFLSRAMMVGLASADLCGTILSQFHIGTAIFMILTILIYRQ